MNVFAVSEYTLEPIMWSQCNDFVLQKYLLSVGRSLNCISINQVLSFLIYVLMSTQILQNMALVFYNPWVKIVALTAFWI